MKYINLFDTQAAYDAAEKYYPNTSYIEASDEVVYQAIDPDYYLKQYLTFEALESGTFSLTVPADVNSTYMTSISYSTDNGTTWVDTTINNTKQTITTPTIAKGGKVLWKGIGNATAKNTAYCSYFSSTGNFNASGNIMSLLYGDNFQNQTTLPNSMNSFAKLFGNETKLISVLNLTLPATTLTEYCYTYMFQNCTSLTTAPELPATTLAGQCYAFMFQNCTSLTTAPELPATTLKNSCYINMFENCTALTTAPTIPSQINSYNYCFQNMYKNCSSLNSITVLITRNNGLSVFSNWVQGVASTGTFTKASSLSLSTGDSGIPSGWTVVDIN